MLPEKKQPPRATKPVKPAAKSADKPGPKPAAKPPRPPRPPENTPRPKPRGVAPAATPARSAARPAAVRPAATRPPAKRQDDVKQMKANNRIVEKARRDAAARHAKMLAAHAKRKSTGQGRIPPVPTLDEFTVAFVNDRLRKSQQRKREDDARSAKPGK